MAKEKEKEVPGIATFMRRALGAAEKEFGKKGVFVAADADKRHIGIPIPNLAMQWLLHSTMYPVQKITLSAGRKSSCKSPFLFEVECWFLQAGGGVVHIDTEKKTSPTLQRSIIPPQYFVPGSDDSMRYQMIYADSIEAWQVAVSLQLDASDQYTLDFKKKPDFPLMIGVDSMTAVQSEGDNEKVESEGAGQGRTYQEAPVLINQYLKPLSGRILGWPITVHFVNHEKPNMGGEGSHTPGGTAKDFHASIDMRFAKTNGGETGSYGIGNKKTDIELVEEGIFGRHIEIYTEKNSFGPDHRHIAVPFLWKYIPNPAVPGEQMQLSWWEWECATAKLLAAHRQDLKKAGIMDLQVTAGAVAHHVAINDEGRWNETVQDPDKARAEGKTVVKRNELGIVCERVGIKKNASVMPRDFGRLVHQDAGLMRELQNFFAIPQVRAFEPGCFDYDDDIERIEKDRAEREKKKKK